MHIFIPTLYRADQLTYNNLPPELRHLVLFVTADSEYLPDGAPYIIQPPSVMGIGPTRQWILDYALDMLEDPYVVMLDDDLRFAARRTDDRTKFKDASPLDIITAFGVIQETLAEGYAHVGMATREGGNRNTDPWIMNTRLLRVLCYRADILREEKVRFDRIHLMEDFDVTLQLLRKGYQNACYNELVHDQRGSNAAGGCSTYRTMTEQARAAHRLKELHPEFVTVVQKQTKTAWGGQERTDVRIAWKQALSADL